MTNRLGFGVEDYIRLYMKSEVEIRSIDERDLREWLDWNNRPLYAVYSKRDNKRIWPIARWPVTRKPISRNADDHYGVCMAWIEEYCYDPNDTLWLPHPKGEYPLHYKPKEIRLIPTGRRDKGGEPLFVIGISGEKILYEPTDTVYGSPHISFDIQEVKGVTQHGCVEWLQQRRSYNPEDKPFRKELLKKLTGLYAGHCLEDIHVIENVRDEEHERHDDLHMILEQGGKYYRCDYVINEVGLSIGEWFISYGHIDNKWYLCKRVYPYKKTIVEFSDAPRG